MWSVCALRSKPDKIRSLSDSLMAMSILNVYGLNPASHLSYYNPCTIINKFKQSNHLRDTCMIFVIYFNNQFQFYGLSLWKRRNVNCYIYIYIYIHILYINSLRFCYIVHFLKRKGSCLHLPFHPYHFFKPILPSYQNIAFMSNLSINCHVFIGQIHLFSYINYLLMMHSLYKRNL